MEVTFSIHINFFKLIARYRYNTMWFFKLQNSSFLINSFILCSNRKTKLYPFQSRIQSNKRRNNVINIIDLTMYKHNNLETKMYLYKVFDLMVRVPLNVFVYISVHILNYNRLAVDTNLNMWLI